MNAAIVRRCHSYSAQKVFTRYFYTRYLTRCGSRRWMRSRTGYLPLVNCGFRGYPFSNTGKHVVGLRGPIAWFDV